MSTAFEYSCGETITIALDITAAEIGYSIADVDTVTAQLRKGARGVRTVDPTAALITSFTVTERPHVSGEYDGWLLTISDTVSKDLLPGYYLVDARIVMNDGGVIVTDQLPIQLIPAVTRV